MDLRFNTDTNSNYDTAFSTSDKANIIQNFNLYNGNNEKSILQNVYRALEDHLQYRNHIINGLTISVNTTKIDISSGRCLINGRLIENVSTTSANFTSYADGDYYLIITLTEDTEYNPRNVLNDTVNIEIVSTYPTDVQNSLILGYINKTGSTLTIIKNVANKNIFYSSKIYPLNNETDLVLYAKTLKNSIPFITLDGVNDKIILSKKVELKELNTVNPESTQDFLIVDNDEIKISSFDISNVARLDQNETIIGNWITNGTFNFNDIVTINAFTYINDIIEIKGNFIIKDSLDTVVFQINDTTGDTTISGDLNITGTTTLTGGISGNTSLTGNLTVSNVVTATGGFSGNLTGNVTGDVIGNADTSSKWQIARTLSLTGDVTGSIDIDGSTDVSITTTVGDNSHNHDYSTLDGFDQELTTTSTVKFNQVKIGNGERLLSDNGTGLKVNSNFWCKSIYPSTTNTMTLGNTNYVWNTLYVNTIYEGGTALSSKYLGISSQAVDSDTVDGLHASAFASSSHTHTKSTSINLYYGYDLNSDWTFDNNEYSTSGSGRTMYKYLDLSTKSTEIIIYFRFVFAELIDGGDGEFKAQLQIKPSTGSTWSYSNYAIFSKSSDYSDYNSITISLPTIDSSNQYRIKFTTTTSGDVTLNVDITGIRIKEVI